MGLEAAEGGEEKEEEEEEGSDGEEGQEGGGGRERAGEVATSPRKSRVMPTRNCTTPRAPLPTPPRSRLALTPPLAHHPVRFSRFFHRPSVSLTLSPFRPPHEIPPTDPRVWCAFSPASARVTSPISPTPRE